LVLEVLGGRLLAPFYGASVETWAAVISVSLGALACGYEIGGRWAQGTRRLTLFALLLLGGALSIACARAFGGPILRATLLMAQGGAIASATFLLGPALFFLGALNPAAACWLAQGKRTFRAGTVYAVSTAGGIAGALATAFVLIPCMGHSAILRTVTLGLIALAAAGAWIARRGNIIIASAVLGAAAAVDLWRGHPLSWAPILSGQTILWHKNSPYGFLQVSDDARHRVLWENGSLLSMMNLRNSKRLIYIPEMMWALALRPGASRALVIGLGSGALTLALERRGLEVDSCEMDPDVVFAAGKFFGFPRRGGAVLVEDGRRCLNKTTGAAYGIVLLDVFRGESIPAHLLSSDFFRLVKSRMDSDGVLAANVTSIVGGRGDEPWIALDKTLKTVFQNVRAFGPRVPDGAPQNVFFFASNASLAERHVPGLELEAPPERLAVAPILTDDFNPWVSISARTCDLERRGRWGPRRPR
jgi:spermidine synthase